MPGDPTEPLATCRLGSASASGSVMGPGALGMSELGMVLKQNSFLQGDIWRFLNKYMIYIQVVPGRAGGGSFRRKKNYIAKKEFAYRMCARRPTSTMPKPFLCCERAFCCSMVVM